MNGQPFTVTTETHGVTDADVKQAVVRKQREAQEKGRKASIRSRLLRLDANLRELQNVYDSAYRTWAGAGSPLRSPNYDLRRGGKPSSKIPPEAEAKTRVCLVMAAQRLAMALRILARHDWLASTAWHPTSLQAISPAWSGSGEPLWRDPDGDVTVTPPDVTLGVSQLRGAVANLQAEDWDDHPDRDVIADFLHEAEEAVNFVGRTGAWFRGMPAEETRLCSRQGCWKESPDGLVCGACRQKDWRDRKKGAA